MLNLSSDQPRYSPWPAATELCTACDERRPILYDSATRDILCGFCASVYLNSSAGLSEAMVQLLAAERRYASNLSNGIAEFVATGASSLVGAAPWVAATHTDEPRTEPPADFLNVSPDVFGFRWVPAHGVNYGVCELCYELPADVLAIGTWDDDTKSVIETPQCRSCSVRKLNDAHELELGLIEAEAAMMLRLAKARGDAARQLLGFIPLALPV